MRRIQRKSDHSSIGLQNCHDETSTTIILVTIAKSEGIENEAMTIPEIAMRENTSPHVEREAPPWITAGDARMMVVRTSAGREKERTRNADTVIEAHLLRAGIDPNTTTDLDEMKSPATSHAPFIKKGLTKTAGDKNWRQL